jgi:hypothetical protein
MHAVVHTLDVDAVDTIEVVFGRGFELAYVRDSGVVHQNVDGTASTNLAEDVFYLLLTGDVAQMPLRRSTIFANIRDNLFGIGSIDFQNVNSRSALRKAKRNGLSNSTGAPRDDRSFAIKLKKARVVAVEIQSETPLFQGMKSSWPSSSALVFTSPLATWMISSKMRSPASSTDSSPAMMVPVSISIASDMRWAS